MEKSPDNSGLSRIDTEQWRSSEALQQLTDTLLERHGEAVNAILLYGSCLRSNDFFDGLVDLYLVVDDYHRFYRRWFPAFANWLLPPNVYYIELPLAERTLRAKYAILSARDFSRGASRRWFHSYIWGRFAQPVALVYCRRDQDRQRVEEGLVSAARTLLERALPCLPPADTVRNLWLKSLQLSYGAELRAEGSGRSALLVDAGFAYYYDLTLVLASSLRYPLKLSGQGLEAAYQVEIRPIIRRWSRCCWWLRKVQGKLLSVLRLLKALFTFNGGLDYIAWKLERHSGQKLVISERTRRYPLIFVWGLFWRSYRRRLFR